jgi:hypothetical protein
MAAVCLRCGTTKSAFDRVCSRCGHAPEGDGLLTAWLLSDQWLSEPELGQAAARIARGEAPRPSARLLDQARRELGQHLTQDPGLGPWRRLMLLLLGVFVTPAVGLAIAWTWWMRYPRAAREALWVSLPTSVVLTALFLWACFGPATA